MAAPDAPNPMLAPCCEHRVDLHQGTKRHGSCSGLDGKCECAMNRGTAAQLARHRRERRVKRAVRLKLQYCPTCGCTEDQACDGGCSWVAGKKICSACDAAIAVPA